MSIFLTIFAIINSFAFIITAIDKGKAIRNSNERISERFLFLLAAAFGALGVYLAMLAFRHKTRKWYFMLGIPLLILENVVVLFMLQEHWL